MIIETVKRMEDSANNLTGYLINNTTSVPLDTGNTDYQEILVWDAIDGNTITEE